MERQEDCCCQATPLQLPVGALTMKWLPVSSHVPAWRLSCGHSVRETRISILICVALEMVHF
jgi:hypothetical protein